jgi:hypothetical protein
MCLWSLLAFGSGFQALGIGFLTALPSLPTRNGQDWVDASILNPGHAGRLDSFGSQKACPEKRQRDGNLSTYTAQLRSWAIFTPFSRKQRPAR